MERAVNPVIKKEMGYKKASKYFNVPSTIVERYVKKKRENPDSILVDKTVGKFHCVFTPEQELELVNYLKDMQQRLFGITMKELRQIAYQLAVKNNCRHNFNTQLEMAGEHWIRNFMTRHKDLSVRLL